MPNHKITIAIVAGEHSGDSYGAMIMAELMRIYPKCNFVGVGGPKMQQFGLKSLMDMDILSVIGIVDVVKKLPALLSAKKNLIKNILFYKPDCFIGVDSPDFNLLVAKKLKQSSIKTIQYISPTVWAWRPKRIFTVAKATNTVLCIFPFEQSIYSEHNISSKYVGHPLTDKLQPRSNQDKITYTDKIIKYISNPQNKNLNNKTIIGIFPGSRSGELNYLGPVFIKTMVWLNKKDLDLHFIVPLVSEKMAVIWGRYYNNIISHENITNIPISTVKLYTQSPGSSASISSTDIMRASDVILCSSGTTTLEAFLLNIPMVVAYKISKINELVLGLLIKVKFVAMPNILSDNFFGEPLVPEFLQKDVTVNNLGKSVLEELKKVSDNNPIENYKSKWQLNNQSKWQKLQNYLKADIINHKQAVTKEIVEIINN